MKQTHNLKSAEATKQFAFRLASRLRGGEIFELSGDVGVGKTVFVKGLAEGLRISETIQSPTFTINRIYETPGGLSLHHYDFYRLNEAGIMRDELAEALEDDRSIVAIEWDDAVRELLPTDRTISITFAYSGEESRNILLSGPEKLSYILGKK